jgi:hypothetical protein
LIALAERLHLAEHGCDGNCGQPMPVGWAARAYDLGVRAEQETRDPVPEGHWAPTRDYWRQRALDAEARATAPAGLREALLMFLSEYEVDGRRELHSLNCLWRKMWVLGGEDEPQCIAARAALHPDKESSR